MKKSNRILIVLLSLLIAAVPTAFAVRSIAAQLSDNDLLVTQSYVDQAVTFQPVHVETGKTLTGKCEFILRSGDAYAVCPGVDGISDMTNGTDIKGGAALAANHYCNIPRDDGRGVKVTRGAWFMLRGAYRIEG